MTPEAWSTIATGIVVLIAIATSHRSLRGEMRGEHGQLRQEMGQLRAAMEKMNEHMNHVEVSLTERINQLETSLTERLYRLRERLSRVEGTLDAVRDSIVRGRHAEPNLQRPGAGST